MSVVYLTSWYEEKHPSRRKELITCLENVVNSSEVDHVHLLAEVAPPFRHEKLSFRLIGVRPTYNHFFAVVNELGQKDDVFVLANTDIYPDTKLKTQLANLGQDECYALSRWDENEHSKFPGDVKLFNRADSQDVWIFRYPVKGGIKGDFCIGIPGCDNRIAHELQSAGYKVLNPSKSIKFVHLHNSGVRYYRSGVDSIPPPYLRVVPVPLITKKTCVVKAEAEPKGQGVLHVGFSQPPLERAFAKEFSVYKFIRWTDYQKDLPKLRRLIYNEYLTGKYRMVFFHVQTADVITADLLQDMYESGVVTDPKFINWTGDVRTPLPQWYIDLGRHMSMTLFSNETDMMTARKAGIRADYLQIGFDTEFFDAGSKGNWPEIVFMGNNYPNHFPLSPLRDQMVKRLRAKYGKMFGVYGAGWGSRAAGNLMNNEKTEAEAYRSCKIAINLSHFDYERYSSDRLFRIMGSGAFCLSHRYKGIEKDFVPGTHLGVWDSLDDLMTQIDHFLESEEDRKQIAQEGYRRAHCCNTWETRIQELKTLITI